MRVVAIVPIKLNNERLPGKNIKILGDKPLINYILNSLEESSGIDEIIVYCSENICSYLPNGVRFIERPKKLDEPTSNFTQIFTTFMKQVHADIYVYTHATAPFLKPRTISECIEKVRDGKFDSAFTASKLQDYFWQDNKPMNFDASELPRTQDLTPIYRETSGVYVFKKEVFQKLRRRIGENPYIKEISFKEAIDINILEDFRLAEFMLNYNIE